MAGSIKTPNAILIARGSKKVRDEIEPEKGEVFPTHELSPEGQKAWGRIVNEMDKLGILSPAYAEFMTIAAGACGDIEIATKDLNQRGFISITERGETKNPSFTIKTSAQGVAHKYLTAIGLTPTAIGKLVPPKKNEESEFAEFI
jgi:P27 family predicted phage terminase small subunit